MSFSILIQGPFSKYTHETYYYYKANSIDTIVSTWNNQQASIPSDDLVVCELPNHSGRMNVNLQTSGILAGIVKLSEKYTGDHLVIKLRSDQRLNICQLENYIKLFQQNQKYKIFAIDLFTRKRIPFHLGDMVLGMPLQEHLKYWNYHDKSCSDQYIDWLEDSRYVLNKLFDINKAMNIPEVALCFNYVSKTEPIEFDQKSWFKFLNEQVFLVSAEDLGLRSKKYAGGKFNVQTFIPARFFSPHHLIASSFVVGCVKPGVIYKPIDNQILLNIINYMFYIYDVLSALPALVIKTFGLIVTAAINFIRKIFLKDYEI
jgi:hypothetical protein